MINSVESWLPLSLRCPRRRRRRRVYNLNCGCSYVHCLFFFHTHIRYFLNILNYFSIRTFAPKDTRSQLKQRKTNRTNENAWDNHWEKTRHNFHRIFAHFFFRGCHFEEHKWKQQAKTERISEFGMDCQRKPANKRDTHTSQRKRERARER